MRPDRDVEPGSLLVASPKLLDSNFRRTVVYVIDHRGAGTLGVVLNRPSEVAVHDVLPAWGPYVTKPQAVFVGGPVDQKTALCLAALNTGEDVGSTDGVIAVRGPVAMVDLDSDPESLVSKVRGLRVFAGYAGWDVDQLSGEIERGDWFVVAGLPGDVLTPPGVDLWGRVLRRQGMPLALQASHPGDVLRN
ncbi:MULTISPECIES: YqgE/AlgH family protein [unclassified Kutzneria]|uniref:YqgE/AlgH family protein n=1 Tax=unclassified Kutzneria TaxID=2621979 RepID=UPI0003EEA58A|nr:YqgE/AlgH family protein [Kutzneria sp. 744]EWM14874.1 transcriptional regulator [Kutzneria sp. 744]